MPWCKTLSAVPTRKNRFTVFIPAQMRVFLHVHFLRRLTLLAGLVFLNLAVIAQDEEPRRRGSQIIDDTTKQVYGPKTSRYYFEDDVFLNRPVYHFIDTAIRNFHRFTYVQRHNNFYQDLGNIGTAIHPIYYQVPDVIGVTSGFGSYDLYWEDEMIRYHDTKSPYSNMKVILGGKGRSITRAAYSRNINPRWNIGFNYRGLFIDKQIERIGKGDRNVRSNYYDFHTAFQTKDSTYRIFLNFRRNKHEADEYGGVQSDGDPFEEYFFTNAIPYLKEASSNELRINVHLFHQYEVGKALQVYHRFDRYRQGNTFADRPGPETDDYYDFTEVDSAVSNDVVKFKTVRNEFGIKGNLLKLFYNGYYAIRGYSMDYNLFDEGTARVNTTGTEHYLGGRMSLRLDSLGEITAWGEILQTGNYRLEGRIASKWFEASLKQVQYAPSFLQQAYRGSHDVWNNNFDDVNVTEINGYLHYRSKVLSLSPGVTFTRIGNYVFFNADPTSPEQIVLPEQTGGEQVFVLPELRLSLAIAKHLFIRGQAVYSKMLSNTGDALQFPEFFANGQLSYENIFFNDNLDMQAGIELHYKSAYYAPAYDVPIQQFYTQRTFEVPDFALIDAFFGARIKRGRIFVKLNNIVQLITKSGYLPTPLYPGQRNTVDFGFDWSFYD